MYGTTSYLESRDKSIKTIVGNSLEKFDLRQHLEFLLHKAKTFRYRRAYAKTIAERNEYTRLLREVEREMEALIKR